jgi:hypothetical protein
LALALAFAAAAPARAARPLLDSGKWDQYFALFARDTQVPWKKITVRLDTYSGAPVDFAAYSVDPYDVLVAGSSAKPRAIRRACVPSCAGVSRRLRGCAINPMMSRCRSKIAKGSTLSKRGVAMLRSKCG